jgi:hypothetical protein
MVTQEQMQHAREVLMDIRRRCGYAEDGELNSQFAHLREMVENSATMCSPPPLWPEFMS